MSNVSEQALQLNRETVELVSQGRLDDALRLALAFNQFAEENLQPEDPLVSRSFNILGTIYLRLERPDAALAPLVRAVALRREFERPPGSSLATSLKGLAFCHYQEGRLREASDGCREALEILDGATEESAHAERGEILRLFALSEMALVCLSAKTGDRRQATERFDQVRALINRAEADGGLTESYLKTLNDYVATVCAPERRYADAERLLREGIDLADRSLGAGHGLLATLWNNLGSIRHSWRNFDAADEAYRRALAALDGGNGDALRERGRVQNNQASLFRLMGRPVEAAVLYAEALAAARQADDIENAVNVLSNLGGLNKDLGAFERALGYYDEALEVARRGGVDAPDNVLANRALALDMLGDADGARAAYRDSLDRVPTAHDQADDEAHDLLWNFASFEAGQGNFDEARRLFDGAIAIEDRALRRNLSESSERHRLAYLEDYASRMYGPLTLALLHQGGSPEAVRRAFELVLRRKGLAIEVAAAVRRAARSGGSPDAEGTLVQLRAVVGELSRLRPAGPAPANGDADLADHLALLERERDELEAMLARQLPELRVALTALQIDARHVQAALRPKSALIEIFRLKPFRFRAVPARGEALFDPPRFVAFVLRSGEAAVACIDLGPASEVEDWLLRFRTEIDRGLNRRDAVTLSASPPASTALESVFVPLLEAVRDCERLFIAPDGALTQLPFEVIPWSDGRLLIDTHRISYLSVARDLLRLDEPSQHPAGPPLVVANPDFDLGARPWATGGLSSEGRGGPAALQFNPLPGTVAEGARVGALLGVEPLTGAAALEGAVKAASSPLILHIATHGFFVPDQPGEAEPRGPEGARRLVDSLSRSGLALAGANVGRAGLPLPDQVEDGLLTAEDASTLNLAATEMVVLSACDTGLGAQLAGEGVFGLRRAFALAGARTLVMSLWKVPDLATAQLMEMFYRLLAAGRPRSDSLREAQLEMRKQGSAVSTWGAFICQGAPGPVDLPADAGKRTGAPAVALEGVGIGGAACDEREFRGPLGSVPCAQVRPACAGERESSMSEHGLTEDVVVCVPKLPTRESWVDVAKQAQAAREDNVPEGLDIEKVARDPAGGKRLMLNIRLQWPKSGVRLTVGFLDNPSRELRAKILSYMNLWNKTANVGFIETESDVAHADVRLARTPNDGHWSWLGIDIRNHPGEPTMNLDGFTMRTPDSEFMRVVPHEAGHTLGFPHEHLRGELIGLLDREKTIEHFMATQGWTREDVIFQLLTPLKRVDHTGTAADPRSIMCYDIPGSCTKNGKPIVGGSEIDATDYAFAARVYPKPAAAT